MATTAPLSAGDGPPADRERDPTLWQRAPGRLFHAALAAPALGLLWSHSVPGFDFFLWSACAALLFLGAVVWGARLVAYALAKRSGRAHGRARWLLVAPVAAAASLLLILADVPLRARWSVSRSQFTTVVAEAMEDGAYSSVGSRRIGLYNVTHVYRQDEGVVFYERTGVLSDDAGFAYLPDGPFDELENGGFERPEFRHLGGPWYAWTASW